MNVDILFICMYIMFQLISIVSVDKIQTAGMKPSRYATFERFIDQVIVKCFKNNLITSTFSIPINWLKNSLANHGILSTSFC